MLVSTPHPSFNIASTGSLVSLRTGYIKFVVTSGYDLYLFMSLVRMNRSVSSLVFSSLNKERASWGWECTVVMSHISIV